MKSKYTIERKKWPVDIMFGLNLDIIPYHIVPFYEKLELRDTIVNTFGDVLIASNEEGYRIVTNDYKRFINIEHMYKTKWVKQ